MRRAAHPPAAFSLIEVAIAVGIAAIAMVAVLGLVAGQARKSGDAADALTALRLTDAVAVELRARARQQGLAALAAATPILSDAVDQGLRFVAARDGTDVRELPGNLEALPREQYFLLEIRRFGEAPLAFQEGVLPVQVRVSWPYRPAAADSSLPPVAFADRQSVSFNLGVRP